MTRTTTVDGTGHVGIDASQGKEIAYDLAGRRVSETHVGQKLVRGDGQTFAPVIGSDGPLIDQDGQPIMAPAGTYTTLGTTAGMTTETFRYDAAGQLTGVVRDGVLVEHKAYDVAGRLVLDETPAGLTANADAVQNQANNQTLQKLGYTPGKSVFNYDPGSNRLHVQTMTRGIEGGTQKVYGEDFSANLVYRYDAAGNLTQTIDDSYGHGGYGYEGSTTTHSNLAIGDTVRQVSNDTDTSPTVPSRHRQGHVGLAYDGDGNLVSVTQSTVTNDNPNRRYVTDAEGRILQVERLNGDGVLIGREHHLIVLGEELLRSADDTLESQWTNSDGQRAQVGNAGSARTQNNLANAPRVYVVQAGDTLARIAQAVWGDASLAGVIAEANGVSDTSLTPGQVLTLPGAEAAGAGNRFSNSTLRPYDASQAIGDTNPNLPPPPSGDGGCGGIGQVLMAVAMVVAAIYTAGASLAAEGASFSAVMEAGAGAMGSGMGFAAAAEAAAVGNIAGQVVGNITGVQDGFSLKSLAASTLSGGIAAGVTGALGVNGAGPANLMARAAIQSTVGQGVNVALGLQDHFSWTAVAASSIAAPLAGAIGGAVSGGQTDAFSRIAGSLAYGLSHQVITTTLAGGKVTAANVAGDAFGNLLASTQTWQMESAGNGNQASLVDSAQVKNEQASQVAAVGDSGIDWNAAERQIQNGYRIAATSPLESNGMVMSTDTPTVDAFGRVVGQGGDQVRVDNISDNMSDWAIDKMAEYRTANPNSRLGTTTLINAYMQAGQNDAAIPQSLDEAKGMAVTEGTSAQSDSAQLKKELIGSQNVAGFNNLADNGNESMGLSGLTRNEWKGFGTGGAIAGATDLSPTLANAARLGFPTPSGSEKTIGSLYEDFKSGFTDTRSVMAPSSLAATAGEVARFAYDVSPLSVPEAYVRSLLDRNPLGAVLALGSIAVPELKVGGALERGAVRDVANSESLAARRAYLNEKFGRTGDLNLDINTRGDRFDTAVNFIEGTGRSNVLSHAGAIDFTKPVDIVTLPKGTELIQYQKPGRPVGSYFAEPGTPANNLGINPEGRVPTTFVLDKDLTVLRSTAKDIVFRDNFYKGGGTQFLIDYKDVGSFFIKR